MNREIIPLVVVSGTTHIAIAANTEMSPSQAKVLAEFLAGAAALEEKMQNDNHD